MTEQLQNAFFGGSTGVIYRQFSITIVSSMLLSVFVAMTLTPALCASLLRLTDVDHHEDATPFWKSSSSAPRRSMAESTARACSSSPWPAEVSVTPRA